jgi:hypothetical protein
MTPEIVNGLPTDSDYPAGGEPLRNREILQSWEALRTLIIKVDAENKGTQPALGICQRMLEKAVKLYEKITVRYTLDQKSNEDHLPAITEGIKKFKQLAELDLG